MRIERTKNAMRNIAFGIPLKVYQIVVPFFMRTAMIYLMGVQYLGLNGLYASILQVLNLAELGVGSAMVYSMYKPIAEDDTERICALMQLYKLYYRIIGLAIAAIGLALTPYIPRLISGEIPDGINLYMLYLLNLATTVFSYWLFAYKISILQVHQRVDVSNKVSIITSTVQYFLQFLVLWLLKDYYIYVIIVLFTQIITNIITAVEADRLYPQYKAQGKLQKADISAINRHIKNLFIIKVGTVIVTSCDTLVISAFLGLTILALYQNYFYIVSSLISFIAIIFTACTAGIGNSLVVDSKEKNLKDLKKLTFLIQWILTFCTASLLCLFQPFIELWIGKDYLLEFSIVVLLCVYFYIFEVNQLLCLYKDAGGIWHKDKYRSWVTSFVSLGMNLIMVKYWGLYGIILSTVLSTFFIGIPWLLQNLFTLVFEKKHMKSFILKLLKYAIAAVIAVGTTYVVCSFVNGNLWWTLLLRGIVCLIWPNAVFILFFFKSQDMKEGILIINNVTSGKFDYFFKKASLIYCKRGDEGLNKIYTYLRGKIVRNRYKSNISGRGNFITGNQDFIKIDNSAKLDLNDYLVLNTNAFEDNNHRSSLLRMDRDTQLISNGFRFMYGSDIILFQGGKLTLGNNSFANSGCKIRCHEKIEIGDNCAISHDVTIMDSDAHKLDGVVHKSPIRIGNHVWIGTRVTILSGASIGEGAVIAAGTVVTHNVPAKCLVGGVPARVIKEKIDWEL